MQNDTTDFLTPVNFLLSYNLIENASKSDKFCKNCPMVDPTFPTTYNKQIMFTKNCGDDDKCEADLRLSASVRNYEYLQPFVIGSSSNLYLDLTVSNDGEAAYQAAVQISAPAWIHFQRLPHTCAVQDDEFVATCFLGNPLKFKETSKLSVNVNVENMPSKASEVLFNVTAHTASIELNENLMDNSVHIVLPLKKVADIAIFGISSHEQISSNSRTTDAKLGFSHKYEVSKLEPSPIDSVTMEISVPITTIQHKDLPLSLFNIRSIKFRESGAGNAIFGECQGVEQELLTASRTAANASKDFNRRRIRSVGHRNGVSGNDGYNNLHILNCSNAQCVVIRCSLGNFVHNETVSFEMEIEAHVENLQKMVQSNSFDTIEFTTVGRVFIDDESSDIQPDNHKPDIAFVSTFFISSKLKPKALSRWIIILSSLAGCLLLFAVTMGLVKLGFFRRQKREEMRCLMHSSHLVKDKSNGLDNLMFSSNDY
uniref:Uncharacterized protein n=1 Tax=Strigamia maritima TaxID=126957 RepID=T1JAM2_STRMM